MKSDRTVDCLYQLQRSYFIQPSVGDVIGYAGY